MNKVTCSVHSVVTYTFTLMVLRLVEGQEKTAPGGMFKWITQEQSQTHCTQERCQCQKQHGNLRGHVINLLGWCEICLGHFAIHFVQHKGSTNVYASRVIVDTESIPSPDTPF